MSTHSAGSGMAVADTAIRPRQGLALLGAALATQGRVLNALILRETRARYGTHKIGFLWSLIEPTATVVVFVLFFTALRQDSPGGMPLVPFMLVGFICFTMFRNPWNLMQPAIGQSKALLTFPQVTTFDVILSRGVLDVAISGFVFVFLLSVAALLGHEVRVERPLGVLAVCLLLCTFGIGAGFLFASLLPLMPSLKQVTGQLFGRPLFFSSGLFFTAESIPSSVRDYLLYNPVLHLIELVRGEFFYEFETRHGSWMYAMGWSFGTLAIGLLAHQALRRRAQSEN